MKETQMILTFLDAMAAAGDQPATGTEDRLTVLHGSHLTGHRHGRAMRRCPAQRQAARTTEPSATGRSHDTRASEIWTAAGGRAMPGISPGARMPPGARSLRRTGRGQPPGARVGACCATVSCCSTMAGNSCPRLPASPYRWPPERLSRQIAFGLSPEPGSDVSARAGVPPATHVHFPDREIGYVADVRPGRCGRWRTPIPVSPAAAEHRRPKRTGRLWAPATASQGNPT